MSSPPSGSRRPDAARSFADRFGAARAHGSYEELAADPGVDVIYVATPHSRHLEDVMLCFEAGKAVLCEKALTMNLADTETLVAEARSRGLFFAEAMWMRANPNIRRIAELAHDGSLGTIGQVRAELGFVGPADDRTPVGPGAGRERPARRRHLPPDVRAPDPRRARQHRRDRDPVRRRASTSTAEPP